MNMKKANILKRVNGAQVKIEVTVYLDYVRGAEYSVSIWTKEPKKRKWDNYAPIPFAYRQMSSLGRVAFENSLYAEIVSEEEIYAVKLDLWEQMKPVKGDL